MTDNEYFLDNDVIHYKTKNEYKTYNANDGTSKATSIILNDNDVFSQYTALNTNITVLKNKIHKKYEIGYNFNLDDIEPGPSGYVLMTDGEGSEPYWVHPDELISGLKDTEIVDSETFLIDYTTWDNTLFNSTGVTVDYSIIMSTNSSIVLNPFEINDTGSYSFYVEMKPVKLSLKTYGANDIFVRDVNLSEDFKYIALTDRGSVILNDVTLTEYESSTGIKTTTPYNVIHSIYVYDLEIEADIYSTSRNYKDMVIADILLENDILFVQYTEKECSGSNFEMTVSSSLGAEIYKIIVELNTTEFLG
jgi:hypothetical protein